MADYIREIQNGTMMIRDTGGNVEFWFKTGSSTFNHQQTWGYQVGGGGYSQQDYDLARGGAWQRFGSVYVGAGANQDVLFRIFGEGLGWPTTDFWVTIQRQSAPPAPTIFHAEALSTTAIRVHFSSNGDGGSGMLEWQLGYGLDPWNPQNFIGYVGNPISIGGLVSGGTYYFWVRGRNALGWSGWSNRAEMRTLSVPFAPAPVKIHRVTQTSVAYSFSPGWDGGVQTEEVQLGYGTDPNAPQSFVSNRPSDWLENLLPGRSYYLWARSRNAIGWSNWSPRAEALLTAGGYVKVDGEWKRALPWIKVGGEWKIGQPNIPVSGTWRVPTS